MAHDFKTYAEMLEQAGPHDDRDYRRGYQQGYSQAMDDFADLLRHKSLSEAWSALCDFFDGDLTAWRNSDDLDQMTQPPRAKVKK